MTTRKMKGFEQRLSLISGSADGFQDSQALQGSLWEKQGWKLQLMTQGAKQPRRERNP